MNDGKMHQLQIRTPEGVAFSFTLASPVTRSLAWVVDGFCIMMSATVINYALILLAFISADLYMGMQVILYFVVSIGYGILLEWVWHGQTVGKRLLRLRVMDRQGFRLRFAQVFLRNLLRPADSLPVFYLLGGVTSLISRHAQRLGDLAAGTVVVRIPRISEPDLTQIPEGKFNSFLSWPHLAARLRQNVSPAEANLALGALLQRESLDLEARLSLYHDLAEHFRAKVVFPQEATDGLSDEHYLRNILGIVFRSQTTAKIVKSEG